LQEDALIIDRKLGQTQNIAMGLNNLGLTILEQGDTAHSSPLLDEAVTLFRSLRDSLSVAGVNINRGLLALYHGDYAQATILLRESLDGGYQLGNTFIVALARQSLGELALRQEAYGDALEELRQAMTLFGELGETKERVTTLELIAHALQGMGRLQPAARVYGAAEAVRETFDAPIDPMRRVTRDQGIAAVQVSLDAMTYDSAWTAGRELSLEQAIAEALAATALS